MASRPGRDVYAETLAVFDRPANRFEPLTTPEVADALDANRRTVYKRLRKLVDRGHLETKETGSNSRVWWRPPPDGPERPAFGGSDDRDPRPTTDRPDEGVIQDAGGTDGWSPAPERRQPQMDYRGLLETIPDGVSLHDPTDGSIIDVNQEICEMLGYTREEFLELDFDALHAGVAPYTSDRAEQYIQRAVTEGPQTFEWLDRTSAGDHLPVEVHLRRTTIGGDDRVLAVVRDITDRKERERELQVRSAAMEASIDGMAILDRNGAYVFVNQAHADIYGYDSPTAFLGATWRMCYDGEELDRFEDEVMPALMEDGSWRGEAIGQRADGTTFPQELSLTVTEDGGIVCVVRDITERKSREREVRETAHQLQGVLDTVEAAIFLKDTEGRYLLMNQNCRDLVGIEADEDVVGLTDEDLFPEDVATQYRSDDERVFEAAETIEIEEEVPSPDGTTISLTRKTPIFDEDGDPYAVCAVSTDITARTERERELRAARQFNEELVENAPFGMVRLDEALRITYENPRAEEIIGLPDDEESSASIGLDIRKVPSIAETGGGNCLTALRDGETIEFEFPFESIYGKEAYISGRGVPLYRDGEFDGAVLMVTDISERRQRERELEQQREQLAALDELNDVVRGITDAVIDQSTREEIEEVVCDRLAASDSYRFAWLCAVDSTLQVDPRVEAGVDGFLDDLPLAPDSIEQTPRGPLGRAVYTREIQLARTAADDTAVEAWQPLAREYGYSSAAAIPIVHRGRLYGVLGVCTERPDAFAVEEREVVGQLGEVIGHAIAAVDRKRALMNDEVTELQIRIPELLASLDISVPPEGTIVFERTIPLGDDDYLAYGRATSDAMDVLHALGDRLPDWTGVRIIDEAGDEVQFELHYTEPPITSIVADHGGRVQAGRIEDGQYRATIHLPPGTDIRRILADIRETYPNVESLTKQQVTRPDAPPRQLRSVLTERLTERQRAALEAAYFGGFFDWPRDRSGEQVAESLDIGASTFHQHVRKAEKKLLDAVFTEP